MTFCHFLTLITPKIGLLTQLKNTLKCRLPSSKNRLQMTSETCDTLVPSKKCSDSKCEHAGALQPLDNFGRNDSIASGVSYYCRSCATRRHLEWKKAHPEKAKEARRAYIERNKARNRARREQSAG